MSQVSFKKRSFTVTVVELVGKVQELQDVKEALARHVQDLNSSWSSNTKLWVAGATASEGEADWQSKAAVPCAFHKCCHGDIRAPAGENTTTVGRAEVWETHKVKKEKKFLAMVYQCEEENEMLRQQLEEERHGQSSERIREDLTIPVMESTSPVHAAGERKHKGKASPTKFFTGENSEVRVKDWLPTLERATTWHTWSEWLIQLPGHLKGKALQEWNFLSAEVKDTWKTVIAALLGCLDPGKKVLAAQDFSHAMQGES